MNEREYIEILIKQRKLWTPEIKAAINRENELQRIFEDKQETFYQLEFKFREIFSKGIKLLFEKHPELKSVIQEKETLAETEKEIYREYINNGGEQYKQLTQAMKTIPQLVEANSMHVEIGKAYFEYLLAFEELNVQINEDRKIFFSDEYLAKMDSLADEGVMMYFLFTPDFPLLDEQSNADFVLDSFIFNDYRSTEILLERLFQISTPSDSMIRKQKDILEAINNMVYGYHRSAARTWFSLLESEHKKCANVLNGYWKKAQEFKNGLHRSERIYELFDQAFNVDWQHKSWKKIDAYYKKMTGKEIIPGVVNRNTLIHGDYTSASMDISNRDVVKIMLMWLNMRLIADHFCYLEEMLENRTSLIPYLCNLSLDIDKLKKT